MASTVVQRAVLLTGILNTIFLPQIAGKAIDKTVPVTLVNAFSPNQPPLPVENNIQGITKAVELNHHDEKNGVNIEGKNEDETPKDELIFAQTVWRHGDRTPQGACPNDPNTEDTWPQGFGQLTAEGMRQHSVLGKRLRARYIEELGLLSPHFVNHEIYVRSTDYNRTLTSAQANMVGFYGAGARRGIDYPDSDDWPIPFAPVAVHTESFPTDSLRLFKNCPRLDTLVALVQQTPEYRGLLEQKGAVIEQLLDVCGIPYLKAKNDDEQLWGLHYIWQMNDSMRVEQFYNRSIPEWMTPELLAEMTEINKHLMRWDAGLGLAPFRGVDMRREIATLAGGSILWTLLDTMQQKARCAQQNQGKDGGHCTHWLSRRKYNAFSVHDLHLIGLFATLGFNQTNVDRDEYPHYAACLGFELWRRAKTRNDAKLEAPEDNFYVRLMYWPDEHEPMRELTHLLAECQISSGAEGCPLNRFIERATPYKPLPSFEELCFTDLPLDAK